ncbi:MAG: DNA repair protein RecN [Clostridiales bacterium]|nr:DNA repair protein RecN [Clostridiales bacterium]
MIKHISIRNFAIIEKTDIDFHDGLNIITGETGAGKSIMIEAVSLALGSRADTAFVRSGREKATIQMIADYKGTEYIITREISAAGRNLCKVNDEIVTLGHLSMLCKKIADIHGQYDHQSLLNPEYHIRLVDLYKKDIINSAKEEVAALYENYASLRNELKALVTQANKDRREKDFMEYEFRELEAAQLRVGEDDELEDEISLLQNSEKIYDNLSNAYMISCDDEYSVQTALKKVSDLLAETGEFSQELSELSSRMSELYYEFEDACHSIRDCRDRTVFSPEDLDTAIARIEVLNKLKNKHGRSIAELIEYRDELGEKLSRIENSSDIKEKLESKLLECRKALISACNRLSEARKASAAELETKITSELQQLNFNDADFHISFSTADSFSAAGTDIVEFMITTNKGESLKPLSKIASGGEMSRIMLAFKKIIGDYDEIPTMIFDEIDSGISGIAASIVGRKLKEIAQNHQIICITHLPQIAAFGEHNYRIEKKSDDKMTFTTVTPLSQEGKTDEIARLLGGANITDTTLQSARELIASSETE